jgi:hypothetical protein
MKTIFIIQVADTRELAEQTRSVLFKPGLTLSCVLGRAFFTQLGRSIMQTVLHIPATSVFKFSPPNILDQRKSLVFYPLPGALTQTPVAVCTTVTKKGTSSSAVCT